MIVQTHSLEHARSLAINYAQELGASDAFRGVHIDGRYISTVVPLLTYLRSCASIQNILDIQAQLDDQLSQSDADNSRRQADEHAADVDRTAGDPLFDVTVARIADAQEQAKYDASVEGKLDKLIAINARIAEALEKR